MKYIFDTSSFRVMDSYYPDQFAPFWYQMTHLVLSGNLYSVDQVRQELLGQTTVRPHVEEWISEHRHIFRSPTSEEARTVSKILATKNFSESLKRRQRMQSGPFADPFVIAAAKVNNACVVTEETKIANSSRIPVICEHFKVQCINLQEFMQQQGWSFRL